MSPSFSKQRLRIARVAIALLAAVAVLGAGIGGRGVLEHESAIAHAFVVDSQRALGSGDRAHAVLALERARASAPRDGLVRSAVATASVQAAEPRVARALHFATSREWAFAATLLGWIAGAAILFTVIRWRRRHAITLAIGASFAFALAMVALVASNGAWPSIVTSADARLLIAPYASAAVEGALPAGTMVFVESRYGGFVHVREPSGQDGWIPQSSIEPIVRSES